MDDTLHRTLETDIPRNNGNDQLPAETDRVSRPYTLPLQPDTDEDVLVHEAAPHMRRAN